MKLKICLLAALCLFLQAKSQTNPSRKFLTVGDHMPDIQINGIINSDIKSANLKDYRGKAVILDFWNTFCSSCVAGFPEWDNYQHQYPKDLQVFLVDKQNKTETAKAVQTVINLTRDNIGKAFKLPIVFNDTIVTSYFQFNTVPHVVWINQNGVIVAITGKQSVTKENMAKLIHGEQLDLPVKTPKDID